MMYNTPSLEIDKVLFRDRPMPLRCRLERRAVWAMLQELRAKGFTAKMTHDGEEWQHTNTDNEVMELVFNLDDTNIRFGGSDGKYCGSVYIVLGNSPEEVICDWSWKDGKPEGDRFNEAVDTFSKEIEKFL